MNKRFNFDLIRAEEELAGARQCIICLCGALLTSSGTAILYKFDAMPAWGMIIASFLLMVFLVVGLIYAFLPTLRENHYRRWVDDEKRTAQNGMDNQNCIDP